MAPYSFPIGPSPNPYSHPIPHSDLVLEYSPLGLIHIRDETLVEQIISEATIASWTTIRCWVPVAGKEVFCWYCIRLL